MQIDLATHIEKLIFLHDTVVVPQLGGFVATRIHSTVDDNGSGAINPPTRALSFNETLVYDDGLLTNDIAQTHGISVEAAHEIVQKEVETLQSRLNQREIVSLNGIGRLYKNYVQKIQFLPDSANFSTESYGLPPLQFSTIARSREVAEQPVAQAETPVYSTPAPPVNTPYQTQAFEPAPRRGRWIVPTVVTLLLVAAAVALWRYRSDDGRNLMDILQGAKETTADTTQQAVATPETAVRTDSFPASSDTSTHNIDDSTASEVEMLTEPEPKKEEQTLVITPESQEVVLGDKEEKAKPTGKGKECILIVATLSDASNIQKLKTKLTANQFTVYESPKGKGQQIGIRFNYSDVVEIQQNIVALQKLTGQTEIWIKKK